MTSTKDDSPDVRQTWFVARDSEIEGPVPLGELARLFLEGELHSDTLVWSPNFEDWRRAETVDALAPFLEADRSGEVPEGPVPSPPELPGTDEQRSAPDGEASPSPEDVDESQPGILGWANDHLWQAAGVAAVAAAALVGGAVLLVGGSEPAAPPPSGLSGPLSALGPAQDSVVQLHLERLHQATEQAPAASRYGAPPNDLAYQRRLAFRGLPQLPDTSLVRFVELWSEVLSRATEAECRSLATWQASNEATWRAVGRLSAERLARLLDVLDQATLAALRDSGSARTLQPAERQKSFELLQKQLAPGRLDTLAAYMQAEAQTPAQECWTDRTLYRMTPQLPEPHDRTMARALLSPPSG